ncbi:hypothetical protein G4V62_00390 [Bacillaceae bacterium SIJ1]|nr:hypothetical protein [Litoribacterium kuwaitense]
MDESALAEVEQILHDSDVKKIVQTGPNESPPRAPVTIWVGEIGEASLVNEALRELDVKALEQLEREGYVLVSGKNADGQKMIILAGKDDRGTFYAAQSFRQLIEHRSGRDWVPGVAIQDWPVMPMRGTIEGFYGEPWSHEKRLDQMRFYGEQKMNTYVYAPKDDPYHRDKWRVPYPEEKLAELEELVNEASSQHVDFVFTISPGLDMCYSSEEDFQRLMDKAQMMWEIGVTDFAILFDDIFQELNCETDREQFGASPSPAAAAQAHVLNRFQQEFVETHKGASPLITVPTEYYEEGTSPYREQFAELVHPDLLVYWTGIGVTTDTITAEDAEHISNIFQHELLIWDNFPVTDFARDRIFLGPLTGRDPDLTEHGVIGLTANPMEHAEASKIPLFTVADYTWNPDDYHAERSWQNSIEAFAGDHVEEIIAFSENARSSPLSEDESPTLTPLIDDFWEEFAVGEATSEGAAIKKELRTWPAVSEHIRTQFHNDRFLQEVAPWLDKMAHYGESGPIAVDMLMAQQRGDHDKTKAYRAALEEELRNDLTEVTVADDRISSRVLDGINRERGSAELIMYTSDYGETTQTNEWGFEVTVVDGKVTALGGNNSSIPDDGYVLSVHSAGDGDWLAKQSLIGSKVNISESVVTITTDKGTYLIPNAKTYAYGVIEPFIEQAIKMNDLWLGGREEAGPFSTMDAYDNYTLDHMNDGDINTLYWTNGPPKKGDFIGLDLGESKVIQQIDVFMGSTTGSAPRPNDIIEHGAIQVSTDGTNWREIAEYKKQTDISITFDQPIETRFIRFIVRSNQTSWAQIREFRVIDE